MEKERLTCEMEITLKVIGGKWKPLIVHYLQYHGERHFSEILRFLGGISKRRCLLRWMSWKPTASSCAR